MNRQIPEGKRIYYGLEEDANVNAALCKDVGMRYEKVDVLPVKELKAMDGKWAYTFHGFLKATKV
jgi:hypothetical protein